jgi:hypothetical protein
MTSNFYRTDRSDNHHFNSSGVIGISLQTRKVVHTQGFDAPYASYAEPVRSCFGLITKKDESKLRLIKDPFTNDIEAAMEKLCARVEMLPRFTSSYILGSRHTYDEDMMLFVYFGLDEDVRNFYKKYSSTWKISKISMLDEHFVVQPHNDWTRYQNNCRITRIEIQENGKIPRFNLALTHVVNYKDRWAYHQQRIVEYCMILYIAGLNYYPILWILDWADSKIFAWPEIKKVQCIERAIHSIRNLRLARSKK